MIEKFTGKYQLTKTLQFSLIPVTEKASDLLCNPFPFKDDQRLADNYQKMKDILDECHKEFIEKVFGSFASSAPDENEKNIVFQKMIAEYTECFLSTNRDKATAKRMNELESNLRKIISDAFTKNDSYSDLFGKKPWKTCLPKLNLSPEERTITEQFENFTTYFSNYHTNRQNMYTSDKQNTSIANRCITDNLPKFLNNIRCYQKISALLPKEMLQSITADTQVLSGKQLDEIFDPKFFICCLSQSGIEHYNKIIGGYTTDNGHKVQGINEYVNLYNQKPEKQERLPFMKPLYKQILSERESISFIPEAFRSDREVLARIAEFCSEKDENDSIQITLCGLRDLFKDLKTFMCDRIFVRAGSAVNDLSQAILENWRMISQEWENAYKVQNPIKRKESTEKYDEKMHKAWKSILSFSLDDLLHLCISADSDISETAVTDYYTTTVYAMTQSVEDSYQAVESLLKADYPHDKSLLQDSEAVAKIKAFLDSVKNLERFLKTLSETGKESETDNDFYGSFEPLVNSLVNIDRLYDMVRNYLTRKPYSQEKIKLNFGIRDFLRGWVNSCTDISDNGTQYGGYLFRKINDIGEYDYFLGISQKPKLFRNSVDTGDDDVSTFERLDYYQPKIKTIYGKSYKGRSSFDEDKQNMILAILHFAERQQDSLMYKELSEYCSNDASTPSGCISLLGGKYPKYLEKLYGDTSFREQNELIIKNLKTTMASMNRLPGAEKIAEKNYSMFTEIMRDIDTLSVNRVFRYFHISKHEMDAATTDEKNPLYLFRIHNKDLGYAETVTKGMRKNRGKENLHTLYFRQLMSGTQNVLDIGSGEIFFRKASIPKNVTHEANFPIRQRKNPEVKSVFPYPLYKDKRYTENQISLHLSLTLNYRIKDKSDINHDIRQALREEKKPYVIGIDRGERNLLYVCVINNRGEIVEQRSLNKIDNGSTLPVDYQKLLDAREADRKKARENWTEIEQIKDLKEGYLSQAIHEICCLIKKYDAIIAMEDLNTGFKNSRVKIEKQVYQKFEKMLTDKLSYLADKATDQNEEGGILNGYQLVNPTDAKHDDKQDGIIFYVPAWLTSKIDPVTGFVDLLHPKYENVTSAKSFFASFDSISFNPETDMFEFSFRYDKFPKGNTSFRKEWTVCTNGERIRTFRNPENNNKFDYKSVNLTEEFIRLFESAGIDYRENLKEQILLRDAKDFFEKLTNLFALTLQMRNSETKKERDYLISPVCGKDGTFYCSEAYSDTDGLPANADANGAYHIARKGLWAIEQIRKAEENETDKVNLAISNKEWLEYVQKQ